MILSHLPVFAAVALLCAILVLDIRSLKIRNKAVLALLALYAVHIVLEGFSGLGGDLAAGALLFAIGLVMWLARGMGAGDAKLMFPLGLLIGMPALPVFAVLLLFVSVMFYLAIVIAALTRGQSSIVTRLREMKQSGKVPYAVPLVLAGGPAIILGLYGPS